MRSIRRFGKNVVPYCKSDIYFLIPYINILTYNKKMFTRKQNAKNTELFQIKPTLSLDNYIPLFPEKPVCNIRIREFPVKEEELCKEYVQLPQTMFRKLTLTNMQNIQTVSVMLNHTIVESWNIYPGQTEFILPIGECKENLSFTCISGNVNPYIHTNFYTGIGCYTSTYIHTYPPEGTFRIRMEEIHISSIIMANMFFGYTWSTFRIGNKMIVYKGDGMYHVIDGEDPSEFIKDRGSGSIHKINSAREQFSRAPYKAKL